MVILYLFVVILCLYVVIWLAFQQEMSLQTEDLAYRCPRPQGSLRPCVRVHANWLKSNLMYTSMEMVVHERDCFLY